MQVVNHPSHYNTPGRKECIVEMQERRGRLCVYLFSQGNSDKYLYRAGLKEDNTTLEDTQKAAWYEARSLQVYNTWNWFQKLILRIATKICF